MSHISIPYHLFPRWIVLRWTTITVLTMAEFSVCGALRGGGRSKECTFLKSIAHGTVYKL